MLRLRLNRRRILAAVVILIVILGLAGLTGLSLSSTRSQFSQNRLGAELASVKVAETGSSTDISILGRSVIYSGQLSVEVNDVNTTVQKIQSDVSRMNGFIADLYIVKGERSKSGTMTIRVPKDRFFRAIHLIEQLGEVKDKRVSSQDVTETQIDLQARLNNAHATEKRLLDILEKSVNVKDILQVENELARVRGEIERIQGQLTFLERRIEFSTITVFIIEPAPQPLLPEANFLESFRAGFQGLVMVVQGFIVLVIILLPLGVIGGIGYCIYRWRKRRRS